MKRIFTAGEIEERLIHIKATTSVWFPMGHFILIKILLHRRKEKFSSLVIKAVINEMEKNLRNDETFTREEVIYELRSLKKTKFRIQAAERLGINQTEVLSEEEGVGQRPMFSKSPVSNFIQEEGQEEKKEAVKTKREIDQYFMETLKQLSDRLGEIEKRQSDTIKKTEES
jgi:hypothetical protein